MKILPDKAITRTVTAAEFKAKCLQLMDEVNERKLIVIVTKRGKPVSQVIAPPAEEKPFRSIVGRTPGIKILGDIVAPMEWPDPTEKWLRVAGKGKRKKKAK